MKDLVCTKSSSSLQGEQFERLCAEHITPTGNSCPIGNNHSNVSLRAYETISARLFLALGILCNLLIAFKDIIYILDPV